MILKIFKEDLIQTISIFKNCLLIQPEHRNLCAISSLSLQTARMEDEENIYEDIEDENFYEELEDPEEPIYDSPWAHFGDDSDETSTDTDTDPEESDEEVDTFCTSFDWEIFGQNVNRSLGLKQIDNLQSVKFEQCDLEFLPDNFMDMSNNLETVHLYDSNFHPQALRQLSTCKTIKELKLKRTTSGQFLSGLTSNDISELSNMAGIERLKITHSFSLSTIPSSLSNLTRLSHLEVINCDLSDECFQVVSSLKLLQHIDFSRNNGISSLPELLECLEDLRYINLSSCTIDSFPDAVFSFKSAEIIDLRNNDIYFLRPDQLSRLIEHAPSTEILYDTEKLMHRGKLEQGPRAYQRYMEELTVFSAAKDDKKKKGSKSLKTFPNLSGMPKLEVVSVANNEKIQSIHPSVLGLKHLNHLNLSGCGFPGFPEMLCQLTTLTSLNLKWNRAIRIIPPSVKNLNQLKQLNISNCGFHQYPEIVSSLVSLETLCLNGMRKINHLPRSITKLKLLHLEIADCGFASYPEVLSKMRTLQYLQISGHKAIAFLPPSVEDLFNLETLNVTACSLEKVPSFLCRMKKLKRVRLDLNPIEVIEKCCINQWTLNEKFLQNMADYFPGDIITLETTKLRRPPELVFMRGANACALYYSELKITDASRCSIHGVHILGKSCAGKSSLIRTMQSGYSTLVEIDDRTVVVDVIQIQRDDVLFNVNDFGGHEIYELTCPLFLRKDHQLVLIAVNLSEYTVEKHDELVTKWLTICLAHMRIGQVAIVATKSDLCSQEQITAKYKELRDQIDAWKNSEMKFLVKRVLEEIKKHGEKNAPTRQIVNMLFKQDFPVFVTSSKNQWNMDKVENYLLREAAKFRTKMPNSWVKMYGALQELQSKSDGEDFLTWAKADKLFQKFIPFHQKIIGSTAKRLHQCLQYLNDAGTILWYPNHLELKKLIFHKQSFLIEALQHLFSHNLPNVPYSEEYVKYIAMKNEFQIQLANFIDTGILTKPLLQCLWHEMEFTRETHRKMEDLLHMLDLCYVETCNNEMLFRFPWFLQKTHVQHTNFIRSNWQHEIPKGMLQYNIYYQFFHTIPSTIYERFCVRLQRHLEPGKCTRRDVKDRVLIIQGGIHLLMQKIDTEEGPHIKMTFRSIIEDLPHFASLIKGILNDMTDLLEDHPGIATDAYFHCPHCVMLGKEEPTRKLLSSLIEDDHVQSMSTVPCDPHAQDSIEHIPAAMVYLQLLGKKLYFLLLKYYYFTLCHS